MEGGQRGCWWANVVGGIVVGVLTKSVGTATDILVAEVAKVRGMVVEGIERARMIGVEFLRRF